MRSTAPVVRAAADLVAQDVYSGLEPWRTQGIDNVEKGFTDFGEHHRGHAIAELLAAYARLTSSRCPDRYRDAAGVPNAVKFQDVLSRFESSHQMYLVPDSREAENLRTVSGGAKHWTVEDSLGSAIDDAHAAVSYQTLLTAAHTGDNDWMQRAARAYAEPVAFSRIAGYMTSTLFLMLSRPSIFEGKI